MIVIRLKGGLGNQLFQLTRAIVFCDKYAQRLLVDDKTGFAYDFKYKRKPNYRLVFNFNSMPLLLAKIIFIATKLVPNNRFIGYWHERYESDSKVEYSLMKLIMLETDIQDVRDYYDSKGQLKYCILESLSFTKMENKTKNNSELGVHVRRFDKDDGDYDISPILDWQVRAINKILCVKPNIRKVKVYSDMHDDSYIKSIAIGLCCDTVKFEYVDGDESSVFIEMMGYETFVGCNSTFSLWARILTNSNKSYFPPFSINGIGRWNPLQMIPANWAKIE
ncbi:hypothetical protein [Limnobacter parvus]|uniref:Alpha-1,2-fucosyltransferase n=1 Tax=Limnobacter parvus TaxID=2939690 RepID=A0ABT1XD73_9BURK|nr:hypothetical protein [Limnobacter parvus]MCR2745215.1 hypothetical protein [Limnobacter parvus]